MPAYHRPLPFRPSPIQVTVAKPVGVRTAGYGGPPLIDSSVILRIWVASEARMCRLCPPEHCTLRVIESLPHVATCVQVVAGDVSPDAAALLRID